MLTQEQQKLSLFGLNPKSSSASSQCSCVKNRPLHGMGIGRSATAIKLYPISSSSHSSPSLSRRLRQPNNNRSATRHHPTTSLSSSPSYEEVLTTNDVVIGVVLAFILAFTASFLQGQRGSSSDFILSNDQFDDTNDEEKSRPHQKQQQEDDELDDLLSSFPSPSSTTTTTTTTEISSSSSSSGSSSSSSSSTTTKTSSSINNNNYNTDGDQGIIFDKESWEEMKRPDNYVLYNKKLKERQAMREKNRGNLIKEQKWVIVAMLSLFVPLFGVELFFALSRQFICGAGIDGSTASSEWSQLLCAPVVASALVVP